MIRGGYVADENEQTRVEMAEMRGELRTALAEITGELKVLRAQNATVEKKVDGLADQVKGLTDTRDTYVTKTDVDRKVRNSTAVAAVFVSVLALLFTSLPALLSQ